ncbi:MAG: glycosyltransferase family 61 protein [SAR324 cluster bacterium]|nr:glycosyltransferase family 61 protein [SAR324 cluster bacterium]
MNGNTINSHKTADCNESQDNHRYIPFSQSDNAASFLLSGAYVCADDGLVEHDGILYFHFQHYTWDLLNPEKNPAQGERKRRVFRRMAEGTVDKTQAQSLSGKYILGISPFINSYYHFICDLLPYLTQAPPWPLLIPAHLPPYYVAFLQQCGILTLTLSPHQVYRIEQLLIPMRTIPDWNESKILVLQKYFDSLIPNKTEKPPFRRIYISRKLVRRRHLINEESLLPLFQKYGFVRVFMEKLTIREQIMLIRETSHLITPHGAALVNVLFAHKDLRLLEIRPTLSSGQFCFEALCKLGWPGYEYIVPPQKPEFVLDIELLKNVLEQWFA